MRRVGVALACEVGPGLTGNTGGKPVKRQLVKGEYYDVVDDEIEMEDDEKGDLKIDKDGNLLGGRYIPRARTTC